MKDVEVYSTGPVYCSACAPADMQKEEVEVQVNALNWSGIETPWRIADEDFETGESNPCPCNDNWTRSERQHWLLVC